MTPIINPWVFYLIDIFSEFKGLFHFVVIFGICLIAFFGILYIVEGSDKYIGFAFKKRFLIPLFVSILGYCVIPSKETMYAMLIANVTTYENVEVVTDSIKNSVDYIMDKFDSKEEE